MIILFKNQKSLILIKNIDIDFALYYYLVIQMLLGILHSASKIHI